MGGYLAGAVPAIGCGTAKCVATAKTGTPLLTKTLVICCGTNLPRRAQPISVLPAGVPRLARARLLASQWQPGSYSRAKNQLEHKMP